MKWFTLIKRGNLNVLDRRFGKSRKQYEATRHNMGFDVIDKLVEEYQIPQGGVKFNAMYGKGIIGGQPALLMKPLSYMNLSGGPVRRWQTTSKLTRKQR